MCELVCECVGVCPVQYDHGDDGDISGAVGVLVVCVSVCWGMSGGVSVFWGMSVFAGVCQGVSVSFGVCQCLLGYVRGCQCVVVCVSVCWGMSMVSVSCGVC